MPAPFLPSLNSTGASNTLHKMLLLLILVFNLRKLCPLPAQIFEDQELSVGRYWFTDFSRSCSINSFGLGKKKSWPGLLIAIEAVPTNRTGRICNVPTSDSLPTLTDKVHRWMKPAGEAQSASTKQTLMRFRPWGGERMEKKITLSIW